MRSLTITERNRRVIFVAPIIFLKKEEQLQQCNLLKGIVRVFTALYPFQTEVSDVLSYVDVTVSLFIPLCQSRSITYVI